MKSKYWNFFIRCTFLCFATLRNSWESLFSDGGNRSGTFIACMNAFDQLKAEQAVDIFQIVRRLKLVRPQFVETMVSFQIFSRSI